LLAVIGIFLGSMSLIVVFNITGAVKKKATQEIEKFGDNLITVVSGQIIRAGRQKAFDIAKTLTLGDVKVLKSVLTDIIDIVPFINRTVVINYKENYVTTNLLAVGDNYFTLKNLYIDIGSAFDSFAINNMFKLCVIGSEIKKKLFVSPVNNVDQQGIVGDMSGSFRIGQSVLEGNIIDKYLNIYNSKFKVIGILKEKGVDFSGANLDDVVIIPISTYMRRLSNLDYIDGMDLKIKNYSIYEELKENIKRILRERHKLKDVDEDDFTIISPVEIKDLKTQTINLVDTLGKITSIISFVIGGLGIFSIMLLIIGLRKIEIGIKRAVGAKRKDIFIQFIFESTFITLSGAFIGIIIGNIITFTIYTFAKLPYFFSLKGFVLTILACVFIGIFSGTYPAIAASKLKPIDIIK
jgi:putative ABC transport system permease protein